MLKVKKLFFIFASRYFLKEIENLFFAFLSSYRNTCESLGELEKAVETLATSRPDMNLQRMFWFWFSLGWLIYFPVTGSPILHEGNGTLITESDVVKSIATLHDALSVLQSLHFVGVTYQLTVSSPGPALFLAGSSHCGRTHCNAMLRQLLLDLSTQHFIITLHLLNYKSICL